MWSVRIVTCYCCQQSKATCASICGQ
jgi:hypothetical protein